MKILEKQMYFFILINLKVVFPYNSWKNISAEGKDLIRKMLHKLPSVRLSAK